MYIPIYKYIYIRHAGGMGCGMQRAGPHLQAPLTPLLSEEGRLVAVGGREVVVVGTLS